MISLRIKKFPSWAFLGPSRAGSRPRLKIAQKFQRLDISGLKTYEKPIANISLRFERKKNWPKNGFLGVSKKAHFWPLLRPVGPFYGPEWPKGGFQIWFWPQTNAWIDFRQNRSRAADSSYNRLRPSLVQTLLRVILDTLIGYPNLNQFT